MKCGITLAKEQKIAALQLSARKLQTELDALLEVHTRQAEAATHFSSSFASFRAQADLEEARNQLIESTVASKQKELLRLRAANQASENTIETLRCENKALSARLHEQHCLWVAQEEVNTLLGQEIKKSKTICESNSNIVKTTMLMKENHECLLRKLAIFENKLQSHHRYLSVLQKKEKERETAKPQPVQKPRSANPKRIPASRGDAFLEAEPEAQKINHSSTKAFSEMVRKKNMMMMKSLK